MADVKQRGHTGWWLAAAVVLVVGCSSNSKVDRGGGERVAERSSQSETESGGDEMSANNSDDGEGLRFEVSEREAGDEQASAARRIEGEPLADSEVDRLLARLPAIESEADDETAFAFRERSKPPPKTGEVETTPFPPSEQRERPDSESPSDDGPLEVERRSPEGEVGVAPRLSVTFSHPMVPVGAAGSLDEIDRPVGIAPEVDGEWRWVGTRTLLFEPDGGRFPMATDYEVAVRQEAESTGGAELEEAPSWTFSTPPVQVERVHPTGGPHSRDPLMFMQFDQRVDRRAILEHVVVWGGSEQYAPKLVAGDRLDDDETVRRLAERAPRNQWIAFEVDRRLRADTEFQIGLEQGAPSVEGERETQEGQFERFRTFSSLEVERAGCPGGTCRPGQAWSVGFNNPLDPESVDASKVRIDPKLPGKEVEVHGDRLVVRGESLGRRTYRLQLSQSIEDTFGQRLGAVDAREIETGAARPMVYGGGGAQVTLDPEGPPAFPVHSINFEALEVRALAVEPSDWSAFLESRGRRGDGELPGEELFDRRVEVGADADTFATTDVDLAEGLDGGHGHLVLEVRGVDAQLPDNGPERIRREHFEVWVQATDLGLDAYVDDEQMVAWATSLADGEPVEGVEVALERGGGSGTTDGDGVAKFELPEDNVGQGSDLLVAEHEGDVAFVPESTHASRGGSSWHRRQSPTEARWVVFDDRNLYRPGETMRLKGWLRVARDEDLAIPEGGTPIEYRVVGSRNNEFASGRVETDAHGGFDLAVEVPGDVNLGSARIEFRAEIDGEVLSNRHTFGIQEFRTPSFEVAVEGESAGPHRVGDTLQVGSEASYYAGGAVRGAEIDWRVESSSASYAPPGWSEFVFGEWEPWWFGTGSEEESTATRLSGRTDATGKHGISVDLEGVSPPEPRSLVTSASVTDVNRQTIASEERFLVHPSELYVGLKTDRWFVGADEPLEVDVVAANIDGEAVAGKAITVQAERLKWRHTGEGSSEEVSETTSCEVETADGPVSCELALEKGGQWRISATIEDAKGRANRTRMRVWVPGGEQPRSEKLEREQLQLVPQKERYEPGETAEVLVQAPFADGQGLAVVQREGVEETIPFSMEGTSHRLELPIEEDDIPNVNLRVDLNGSAARESDAGEAAEDLPDRPAFATGDLELPVSRESKELDVEVTPSSGEIAPGSELEVEVEVRDASGDPAAESQVALVAVDEAILAAADYELGDPLETLFPTHASGVRTHHLRPSVLLSSLEQLRDVEMEDAEGDHGHAITKREMAALAQEASPSRGAGGGGGEPIDLREDFRPLAHFAPALETDEEGWVEASFELPDNLTRYRLMAVAVEGAEQAGVGESQVTARLPLMVEPSMPRFLNWGDEADLPVVIRNQTGDAREVRLAARATNLEMGGARGYQFEVPAGDRVELRFPAATSSAGRARLQFAAASEGWSDAAAADFPVWTPATTEAFADYGTIDAGEGPIARRIEVPDDAIGTFGALEVTTSSTALEQLTDAFVYLVDYPYDCSEQVASRLLSVAALRDVLEAFDAEGLPEGDKLDEMVRRDVERLETLQRPDGGFAMWSGRGRTRPFPSVHAAHALTVADDEGVDVSKGVLERSRRYLRDIDEKLPQEWSGKLRRTVRAYALYVLEKMGSPEPGETERLAERAVGEELSIEAAGWLVSALAGLPASTDAEKKLRRQLANRVVEEAGTAHFATDYSDEGHVVMHSNRRSDAVVLEALIRANPDSSLIPKVVEGLMAGRTKGRWSNTQENVFVLLALDRYFETFEEESPDFAAEMWLGDEYVGEHRFRERTTESRRVEVPVSAVRQVADGSGDEGARLTVGREGTGRMYYRIGLRYAPESLDLEPLERGFAVERTYEAVDDDSDVRRTDDGSWEIEAGARVRVRLQMVAPARRHHVALVDPLAGGFESLNPAIATTEPIPEDPDDTERRGPFWWWHRPWFEHQNLRDERTEAFTSRLAAGVHEYTYVVRATTPGEFVVPPPKAEEMYHPETFGRGGTDRVTVD